ncbi:RNA-binding domain-containing protein [Hypoxylon sp. FL0543]|nr:RNA-binding domain-containing protein [Hypoxylon sp. FL0543]
MFIGGLNWETTDQSLRDYFSQFGEVTECTVMRDGATGRSRGFGFLTFKDPKTVNIVMVKEHFLDGKIIDPKRAIPRDEQEKTSKIFVGGVSQDTTEPEFKDYFAQFGRVVDATLMMDKDTGRPRGFGFVTFESEAGVEACLSTHLEIHGKPIEVKKAQPRGNMREEEEASRRTKFRKGGMDEQPSSQNQMANQMGQGGMTPQVMAQYMQRMQQYMAMMQQQMAMNRGMGIGAMNPAMMQMMHMQQMQQMQQQMSQGGGQNAQGNPMTTMASMNPALMQQMQQMQQQMQNQMMGNGGEQGQGQGDGNQPGFGNFNQQQMFNPRGGGGRRGGRGGYNQQNYGNMGGGDPTSWEGMYDDVPQPNFNQGGRGGFNRRGGGHQANSGPADPNHAPPANAPTGPKNAGKPGANYRGGGRGGSRGFHPYGR